MLSSCASITTSLRRPLVEARIEAAVRDGRNGFWIDMGVPTYGLSAVDASPEYVGVSEFEGRATFRVFALEQIEASWPCSQFVNVGNPHCVTFLKDPSLLPSMEQIGSQNWMPRLTAIANSTESDGVRGAGRPCKNGINLQWASLVGSGYHCCAGFRAWRGTYIVLRIQRNGRRECRKGAGASRCEDRQCCDAGRRCAGSIR